MPRPLDPPADPTADPVAASRARAVGRSRTASAGHSATGHPVSRATRPQLPVLRTLRVALHVMFAFLLGFGLVRYLWTGTRVPDAAPAACAIAATALLAAVYLAGTVWENRHARRAGRGETVPGSEPGAGPGAGPEGAPSGVPRRWAGSWLAAVTLLWLCLVAISPDFVWVVFPLMFLFLHLYPHRTGLAAVVLLWAVSALVPLAHGGGDYSAGAAVGPLLGAVLAVVISSTYRSLAADAEHHARTAEALRLAQAELAERERRAGRAEERERLAREIHDTVAQGLSSILLVARAARAGLAAGNTRQVQRQLAVIEEGAGENLAQARRFVRDLAAVPEGPGLPEALTALCRRTEAQEAARGQRLECSLRLEGREATQLPEPVQTALLRGAQASLANVTAHAGAARAVLTLTVSAEEALLDVYDDGVGFDPATLEDPRAAGGSDSGYGLPGLRRRLQTLGGSLTVDSAPEEGTVIGMRLPLTSATGDAVGSASTADDASEETAESAAALDAAAGTAGRVAGAAPSAGPRETQDGRRG
ncbi:sensor histidine kinase [Rothia kristinae]|uniref:sensor histidine kinase n=1 Tax=Rothia kristinae TaxID=37923 RepID=UPI00296F4ACE|nr:sensor histidine kinase [Rothia kristinae]